jgi:hypothetical protein
MEPSRPEEPRVEVIDTGAPPSAFERWARSLLERRGAKAVSVVGVVLLVLGLWVAFSPDDEQAAAEADTDEPPAALSSTGLRPGPARGREAESSAWKVSPDVAVRRGPEGYSVTFFAVNRGSEPQDPSTFEVSASFVDRPALSYSAECAAVELTRHGYKPLQGSVKPGQGVFVRCTDTTRYRGAPARIDAKTVVVRTTGCHESGRQPGV